MPSGNMAARAAARLVQSCLNGSKKESGMMCFGLIFPNASISLPLSGKSFVVFAVKYERATFSSEGGEGTKERVSVSTFHQVLISPDETNTKRFPLSSFTTLIPHFDRLVRTRANPLKDKEDGAFRFGFRSAL